MRNYLSRQILTSSTLVYQQVMRSTFPELCLEGKARTGKSIIGIRKLLALHAMHKGLRSCIARTKAVDLNDTIRYDLRNTVLQFAFDDPRSQIKQQGGPTRFDHLYLNGGEMRLGGLDRPTALLGGQYDIAFLNELSQFNEEQFQLMKTRCSGSSGKWRDADGKIYYQILADTNPDIHEHFMYEREKHGLMQFLTFDFTDNPAFYRDGRWSRLGKTTVDGLDKGLTGFWHDRYFKGLRGSPEGIVYQLTSENILQSFPDLEGCSLYRACDWGQTHPSICLWIARNEETSDVFCYREWRKTHSDIIEMGDQIRAFSENEDIEATIIDHDENRQILLRDQCNIHSEFAYKGAGSVLERVFLIQSALRNAQEGKPGGLYIYKDLVCNNDPNPNPKLKKSIIDEMQTLKFQSGKDAPMKIGDDACDALGYFFLYHARLQENPGFSSIIKRQKPDWFLRSKHSP